MARRALYNFHMQPHPRPLLPHPQAVEEFHLIATHTRTHTETGIHKYENGIAVSRQRKAMAWQQKLGLAEEEGRGEQLQWQQRQLLLITCMRLVGVVVIAGHAGRMRDICRRKTLTLCHVVFI